MSPVPHHVKVASTIGRHGCFGSRPGDLINGGIGSTSSAAYRSKLTHTAIHAPSPELPGVAASPRDTPCNTTFKLALKHVITVLTDDLDGGDADRTHLSIGLDIRACQAGHRVAFATAAQWVSRLADAHVAGKLQDELVKLGRIPLLIIDEVGYIPFAPEAANLFFQLASARYERASLIVTSNKPFGRWGEVFGDDVVAAAMIDRLVHHAEVISMKDDSYRLKDRDLGRGPAATKTND